MTPGEASVLLGRPVRVAACGCWVVLPYRDGYPRRRLPRQGAMRRQAAALIWERAGGNVPPGTVLRRLCGVPLCVRPDHTSVASRADVGHLGGFPYRQAAAG